MVDPVVILEVEAHGPAIVGLHGHGLRADLLDGAKGAVLHAKLAFVLQEHDAISVGKTACATFDCDVHILAQIAGVVHPHPRCLVQRPYLVIGMGQDNPGPIR